MLSINHNDKSVVVDNHDDKPFVILHCSDGILAISHTELKAIMRSGNVFQYLLYGHYALCAEKKLDVLKQFNVSIINFNTLRSCIRGLHSTDTIIQAALNSGELRNTADTLGGFDIIDDIIKAWELKHILADQEKNAKNAVIDHSLKDTKNEYEWANIPMSSGLPPYNRISAIEQEGFSFVSERNVEIPNCHMLIFRRLKIKNAD